MGQFYSDRWNCMGYQIFSRPEMRISGQRTFWTAHHTFWAPPDFSPGKRQGSAFWNHHNGCIRPLRQHDGCLWTWRHWVGRHLCGCIKGSSTQKDLITIIPVGMKYNPVSFHSRISTAGYRRASFSHHEVFPRAPPRTGAFLQESKTFNLTKIKLLCLFILP